MASSPENETRNSYLASSIALAANRAALRLWAAAGGYHALTFAWSSIYDLDRHARGSLIPGAPDWLPFVTSMGEVVGFAGSIVAYCVFTNRLFGYPEPPNIA